MMSKQRKAKFDRLLEESFNDVHTAIKAFNRSRSARARAALAEAMITLNCFSGDQWQAEIVEHKGDLILLLTGSDAAPEAYRVGRAA